MARELTEQDFDRYAERSKYAALAAKLQEAILADLDGGPLDPFNMSWDGNVGMSPLDFWEA